MWRLSAEDIVATSVAGLETCVEVPSWRLCFDIGRCPPGAERSDRVLFSHAHCDHMGGVIHHCATRDLLGMSPPEYVLPAENEEDFHALLEVWRRLDGSPLRCAVRGVRPGDKIEVGKGRRIEVFAAPHRVPAVGYALVVRARRLRDGLAGLPGSELGRMRKAGIDIEVSHDEVVLAYTGDSTVEVLEREPLVRAAQLLLLEATFLDERVSPEAARRLGHVHLDDLIERQDLLDNPSILLFHVSARYAPEEIRPILARRLPAGLRERVGVILPPTRTNRRGRAL